jgi:hypothetical protein
MTTLCEWRTRNQNEAALIKSCEEYRKEYCLIASEDRQHEHLKGLGDRYQVIELVLSYTKLFLNRLWTHYLRTKLDSLFQRRRVVRTLVPVQSWWWLSILHERARRWIRHIHWATNRLCIANIAFAVGILRRALDCSRITDFP